MRYFVIASLVNGSILAASVASAQQQPGYGASPTPAPTYTPAPMQPAPTAPAPAPQPAPSQYGQPAPVQGSQTAPQPQYAQPAPQPQYGQPAPQPAPQQQYAPQQQPQPQYAPQQQQSSQPGYGQQAPAYGEMAPPPPPTDAGMWRPSKARFIIAGERLFGFSYLNGSASPSGGPSVDGSATMVSLLWANSSVRIADYNALNPYAIPMLTFHGVVGGGVTIGGGVGFASTAGSHDNIDPATGGKTSVDDPTRTAFAFAPRVGYLASFSPTFGLWPKGGITYWSQKQEINRPGSTDCSSGTCFTTPAQSSSVTISGVAVSADLMFVLAPVPHVGILFGPTFDIGVGGTLTEESNGTKVDTDLKVSNYGVAAGIALLF